MSTIHLWSPLQPAEFAERLAAAIDPEPTGITFGLNQNVGKPVIGRVQGRTVRLHKRIDPTRNSFQSYLVADFEPARAGTSLVGTVGMNPFVGGCMVLWFVGVALLGSVGSLIVLTNPSAIHGSAPHWLPLVSAPCMLLIGFVVAMGGRQAARGEDAFLLAFLAQTLDAREMPPA